MSESRKILHQVVPMASRGNLFFFIFLDLLYFRKRDRSIKFPFCHSTASTFHSSHILLH